MRENYDGVDERLDVSLVCTESEPHSSHHDCQSHVHRDSNPVNREVAVALDERAVQEREDLAHGGRLLS